jgi:predicted TIM-barrel fold metal-dependent hydrolase
MFQKHHLDAYQIDYAIMISGDLLGVGGLPDADMSAALISANNDWLLEEWAMKDERLKLSINVNPRDMILAVKEIERLGNHPAVVQVQIPETDILLGNRHYYPIYEAAEDLNLPIPFHGGEESAGVNPSMCSVEIPSYFIEVHTGMPIIAQAHLISLIAEGVFERFPGMKVVLQEMGYAWVPGIMWRYDQEWRSLRAEVPWLKRPPSEYILEHFPFTSQPIAEPPKPEQHLQILDMMNAEKTLLFSSDYPHWDFDDPRHVFTEAREELRRRIYFESASELYGLDPR